MTSIFSSSPMVSTGARPWRRIRSHVTGSGIEPSTCWCSSTLRIESSASRAAASDPAAVTSAGLGRDVAADARHVLVGHADEHDAVSRHLALHLRRLAHHLALDVDRLLVARQEEAALEPIADGQLLVGLEQ